MSDKQRVELRDLLNDLLDEPEDDLDEQADRGRPAPEVAGGGSVSYSIEYRKCGKPGCKCARGERHGPYGYEHRWVDGRKVSRYLGKVDG